MEQLTKNQAVATSQEAVQNQNEPQLRNETAHNDKSVHGVLNSTYHSGLRRDAVQPDIDFVFFFFNDTATTEIYTSFPTRRSSDPAGLMDLPTGFSYSVIADWKETMDDGLRSEEHTSELQSRENLVCRLLLEKK